MDLVCNFGRSVDVDGDGWIDLGLPSAPLEIDEPVQVNTNRDIKLRDKNYTVISAQANAISEPPAISEPNMEPEPEQPDTDTKKTSLQRNQHKKSVKVTEPQKSQIRASSPMLKAAKSKEALMAFYLGRAKQMEAKHKKIVVTKTQDSMRSAPFGL